MMRGAILLIALAGANAYSCYSPCDFLNNVDYASCYRQPIALPAPRAALPATIACAPVGTGINPADPNAVNLSAITALLNALKNTGLVNPLPGSPGTPPTPGTDPLLFIKLLNILTLGLGSGTPAIPGTSGTPGGLPINGTTPGQGGVVGGLGLGGLLRELLESLLGNPAAPVKPNDLNAILLQILASLATPAPANGLCPAGTAPIILPAAPCAPSPCVC